MNLRHISKSIVLSIVGACVLLGVVAWVGVRVVGQLGVQTYEVISRLFIRRMVNTSTSSSDASVAPPR